MGVVIVIKSFYKIQKYDTKSSLSEYSSKWSLKYLFTSCARSIRFIFIKAVLNVIHVTGDGCRCLHFSTASSKGLPIGGFRISIRSFRLRPNRCANSSVLRVAVYGRHIDNISLVSGSLFKTSLIFGFAVLKQNYKLLLYVHYNCIPHSVTSCEPPCKDERIRIVNKNNKYNYNHYHHDPLELVG